MYVIIIYDIKDENDSYRKVIKSLRKYLDWVQNSAFEGELTKSEFETLKDNLDEIKMGGDSIIIYKLSTKKNVDKQILGEELGDTSPFL